MWGLCSCRRDNACHWHGVGRSVRARMELPVRVNPVLEGAFFLKSLNFFKVTKSERRNRTCMYRKCTETSRVKSLASTGYKSACSPIQWSVSDHFRPAGLHGYTYHGSCPTWFGSLKQKRMLLSRLALQVCAVRVHVHACAHGCVYACMPVCTCACVRVCKCA